MRNQSFLLLASLLYDVDDIQPNVSRPNAACFHHNLHHQGRHGSYVQRRDKQPNYDDFLLLCLRIPEKVLLQESVEFKVVVLWKNVREREKASPERITVLSK